MWQLLITHTLVDGSLPKVYKEMTGDCSNFFFNLYAIVTTTSC